MLATIREQGPISVERYMALCNEHYYATRDPLGAGGDFTTAPEISQMFGELVGAALADAWLRAGAPADAIYIELGPGRGTLAADALRVMRGAGFAGEVHLVETSPMLRTEQSRRVGRADWHADIAALPRRPLLLAANEFLDALPVRQWTGEAERLVTIEGDALRFAGDGPIREDSPARDAAVHAISSHIAQHGGIALIIDYGHERTSPGDTLQAVRSHGFADVLADPGEQDLTSHVDFEQVAKTAASAGVRATRLVAQGIWLERLGIGARASALKQSHPQRAEEIDAARDRLCAPGEMGELFKVLGLHAPDWPAPAGFDA